MTTIRQTGSIFIGSDEDDSVTALANGIRIEGAGGDDWLTAALIDARPFGGSGLSSQLNGDAGNDVLHVLIVDSDEESTFTSSIIYGGDGNDMIGSDVDSYLGSSNWADGGDGDDVIRLESRQTYANPEALYVSLSAAGGAGNDRITLIGSSFDAGVRYNAGGGAGDDWISLKGSADSGVMFSTVGGNQGNDTLIGSTGDDTLTGGQGADCLTGRGGADTFEFWGARGLSAGERDRIEDFEIGSDLIDVSRIDANVFRSGNQSFRFNASPDDWQGTGRLWVEDNPDNEGSIVYASTGRALLAVNLLDGTEVSASDYSAGDFIL